MNNTIRTTLLGGLLTAAIALPTQAGDFASPLESGTTGTMTKPSSADVFSFTAGYHSTYLWRGINFGDEMVDWGVEATKSFGSFDLTAGVWAAEVLTLDHGAGDSEVDFYVGASKDLGFATLELGYIYYYFSSGTSANTQELSLGLSKEIAGTSFSITYNKDIDLTDNSYIELGVERSLFVVDAAVAVGFDVEESELTHAQITLSKSFNLNSAVTATPYAAYSYAFEDMIGTTARENEFVAGVSIGFSF